MSRQQQRQALVSFPMVFRCNLLINRVSTTTVYPQSQPTPPSHPPPPPLSSLTTELLPTSPLRSEKSLSIEVHGLEMKYREDDQLAVAIECDQKLKRR